MTNKEPSYLFHVTPDDDTGELCNVQCEYTVPCMLHSQLRCPSTALAFQSTLGPVYDVLNMLIHRR